MKNLPYLFVIICINYLFFGCTSKQRDDVTLNIRYNERIEMTAKTSDTIFSSKNIKVSSIVDSMIIPILSLKAENFPDIKEKRNTTTKISSSSNGDTSITTSLTNNSLQILNFQKFFGYTNEQDDIIDHSVDGVSEHIVSKIENGIDSTEFFISCKFSIEFRGNCINGYTDESIIYFLNNEILNKYNELIIKESGILK